MTKFFRSPLSRSAGALVFVAACMTLSPALAADAAAPGTASPATAVPAPAHVKTESGLQYTDVVVGKGALAAPGKAVRVHYTGWLQKPDGSAGQKFDSSRDRGDPFAFALGGGQVIRGWDEGVAGMRVGGQRKLIIPAAIGYGARGAGGVIPPNATLLFDVELLDVH